MKEDYKPGDKVIIRSGIFMGQEGEVVHSEAKRWFHLPVFLPRYPGTMYWWMSPRELKEVEG